MMFPLDSTGRKKAKLAVWRLAAIAASSEDAIIAKDLNGIITSWNEGAERLFGYHEEEAIGQPIAIIIPRDRQDEEANILARIRAGERVSPYETIRQRKDGSPIEISLSVSPIKDAKGRIVGASKIARDITEKRRAEERQVLLLREMNHRIKNLFTIASSIVALSEREAATVQELSRSVQKRLAALARAHSLTLAKPSVEHPERTHGTTLHALIQTILVPFENEGMDGVKRVNIMGPDLQVGASWVTSFALLLHEFATNAAKYGALSAPAGRICIGCRQEQGRFTLVWSEHGGPPANKEAFEQGFGGLLVEATVRHQLKGELTREWTPEGLVLRLTFDGEQVAR
jgi:PAS domain S-box-containing protein